MVRNKKIWEEADEGIAFWDGKSRGTKHSFKLAEKAGKDLRVLFPTDVMKKGICKYMKCSHAI